MLVGKAIKFNPSESIPKGRVARKIPMGALTEFQRKINGFENSEYYSGPKFRNGDTIVAKITPCLENGKTAFVDILDQEEIAFGSSEFIVLRHTEFTDSEFIYYFARSPLFRDRAISCMEGTSGRKRVNENTLKNLEFEFPDLPSQKSISKVLSALDAKIELNNRINTELEAMAKLIYDYWFVQFDFPNEQNKPYKSSGGKMVWNEELKREIPEGWEVEPLGSQFSIFDSLRVPLSSSQRKNKKGKIPYYGATSIMDYVDEYIFDDEYILLAEDGSVMDENGFPIVQFIWGKTWVNNHAHVIQAANKINNEFIFQLVKRIPVVSIKTGSIQLKINQENLKAFKVVVPPMNLIETYSVTAGSLRKQLINNIEQNQHLTSLRDWLLPMLMNGQVRVREDIEIAPAMAAEDGGRYGM